MSLADWQKMYDFFFPIFEINLNLLNFRLNGADIAPFKNCMTRN